MNAVFMFKHLTSTSAPTPFTLQGTSNFRDVSSYRTTEGQDVRRRRVFRSDHLAGLTDSDMARLQALVAQSVVPTTEETVELMRESYRDFVNHNAGTFGRFLKHLLEQPTPQVFHCTAGKERTGFATALLLSALGVDRATIEHDYLLTNQLYKRDARLEGQGHPHVMKVLWQVQPEFLHAAFEAVDTAHGGMPTI